MALTGPEKAMYNFLIKREAAGNLNATQSKQLAALKAKQGPASPASPQPLKGKVVTAPPPPAADAAKQAAAAKAAAAQKSAAAKAQADAAKKAAELKAMLSEQNKMMKKLSLNFLIFSVKKLIQRMISSLSQELVKKVKIWILTV